MSLAISGALLGGLAIAGGGIASSMIGTNATQSAASDQEQAALQGQQIQQQEFQQVQQLLAPYVSTGNSAETAQGNLLGLNGNAAQTAAINGIENSGQYQALNQQGQRAILQNAAATGGVRGGNVQASLAQFSPALLQSMIQQQYSNLGGLSTMGENAAAGTGRPAKTWRTMFHRLCSNTARRRPAAFLEARTRRSKVSIQLRKVSACLPV